MRFALVTLIAAAGVLAASSPGLGEGAATGLAVQRAKVRLHKVRGMSRDRMKVRATFPMLEGDYVPWRDSVDFLVVGAEVLCEPGGFPPPEGDFRDPSQPVPSDPDPTTPGDPYYYPDQPSPYASPVRGTDGAAREWTIQERTDGTWVFRADGRRLHLNLVRGTLVVSGRNLALDALPDAGPGGVDLSLGLGTDLFGTVIDFETRGRTWSFRSE